MAVVLLRPMLFVTNLKCYLLWNQKHESQKQGLVCLCTTRCAQINKPLEFPVEVSLGGPGSYGG